MAINFEDICLVAQRELRHYLRDPHVLIYSVLLPALLYPTVVVLMIEGSLWQDSLAEKRGLKLAVGTALSHDAATFVESLKKSSNVSFVNASNPLNALKSGEVDGVIEQGLSGDTNISVPAKIIGDSYSPQSKIEKLVERFQKDSLKSELAKHNLTPDQMTPFLIKQINASKVATSLTTIIPYVCCLALMIMSLGAIYPAISAFTEEREKKTLESTLTLPVDRLVLVLGKHAANSLVTLLSALLNLVFILCVVALMGSLPQSESLQLSKSAWFTFPQLCMLSLAFIINACEVSAWFLLLSQFTRTFREAQNLLTMPSLFLSFLSLFAMNPTLVLTLPVSLIPLLNTYVYCKAIYSNNVPWGLCFLSLAVNAAVTVVLLAIISKIVEHEQFGLMQSSIKKIFTNLKVKT